MAFDIVKVLLGAIFFTSLIGVIADQVSLVGGNVSGAALVIVGLIVLIVALSFISNLVKDTGLQKK